MEYHHLRKNMVVKKGKGRFRALLHALLTTISKNNLRSWPAMRKFLIFVDSLPLLTVLFVCSQEQVITATLLFTRLCKSRVTIIRQVHA